MRLHSAPLAAPLAAPLSTSLAASLAGLLAVLASGVSIQPAVAADGVRAVTLSSGGLAEIRRSAGVDGEATKCLQPRVGEP